jgi:FhaA, N-terminal domain/FHA domain
VNPLKSIEKRMEKTVESLFGRAFKASVQPVELAHKLAKEMGDHKTVSVSRVYVPNAYEIFLSPPDYEQLHSFEATLADELSSYLVAYAKREGWTLVAKPTVALQADADLSLGEFGIAAHTTAPEAAGAGGGAASIAPLVPPPDRRLSQTLVFGPPDTAAAPLAPPAAVPGPGTAAPAPFAPAAPERLCAVLRGPGIESVVDGDVAVIGRSKQCDIVVADPNVSRRHAEIRRQDDGFVVVDLQSTNGIRVNGREVKRAALADGDRLQVGTTRLRFETRPC